MQNIQDNKQLSEVIFSWKCHDYIKYKKNTYWYLISFLILVAMVGWAIYTVNYLFAVFLVLFYLIVIMYEFKESEVIDCIITPDGIKHGKNFFFYKSIDNFFIIYRDYGIKNLYIDFKNPLRGRLVIDLEGLDAVKIREFLLQFLAEDLDREVEPISERLRRWLRI
ncbi:hypothetical protein GW933_02950 [Candidatus Falkowbacteria bacterium]|uniref:DUF5673 domain-containing protein n=1 Tax=Candidatus Buchananbacteria bacterium CG10_big_fil_rev_8_21_14_0_10_33_19 TaxID=1974525 RepID=A0A2H0W4R5_9BACT|nr:hypothetical protein [Candidatus Falkowbacteria bacterium]PIS06267.1 MAG: hypothetical protein COT80_01705 [Candidatus Buchananbacteria bacterium CG10_big_fil_rev_8_21_14_0_10_33_19]